MANSYEQTCFGIENVTNKEYAWIKEMTRKLQDVESQEEGIPELDDFVSHGWTGWKLVTMVTGIQGEAITEDNVRGEVYFDIEEGFDNDALIALLQGFLKKFRPDGVIGFEIAYTCSKMRPDEFGGSAIVITADEVQSFGTAAWLLDRLGEYRAQGKVRA